MVGLRDGRLASWVVVAAAFMFGIRRGSSLWEDPEAWGCDVEITWRSDWVRQVPGGGGPMIDAHSSTAAILCRERSSTEPNDSAAMPPAQSDHGSKSCT